MDDEKDEWPRSGSDVPRVKGCPICERTDMQLARQLQEFAQVLFEMMIADQAQDPDEPEARRVDNGA